jgi:hypothetical protein
LTKHQPPSIQVVLDTNCLFTEAADKLICADLSEFILNDSRQLGLKITWHLPSVVKAERKYQMMERGKKLLPNLAKVESLLGHALGINAEVLAKVWLEPEVSLDESYGFNPRELSNILRIVAENRDLILRAWHDHFGD